MNNINKIILVKRSSLKGQLLNLDIPRFALAKKIGVSEPTLIRWLDEIDVPPSHILDEIYLIINEATRRTTIPTDPNKKIKKEVLHPVKKVKRAQRTLERV